MLINKVHLITINSLPLFKSNNHCRTTSSKSLHNRLTPKKWIQLGRVLKVFNRVWSQLKRTLMAKLCNSTCQIIKTFRHRLEKPSVSTHDQNNNNSKQHRFLFSIIHRLSLHQPLRTLSNAHQQISIPLWRSHPFSNQFKLKAQSQLFNSINRWLLHNIKAPLWPSPTLFQSTSSKKVNRKLLKKEMASSNWT